MSWLYKCIHNLSATNQMLRTCMQPLQVFDLVAICEYALTKLSVLAIVCELNVLCCLNIAFAWFLNFEFYHLSVPLYFLALWLHEIETHCPGETHLGQATWMCCLIYIFVMWTVLPWCTRLIHSFHLFLILVQHFSNVSKLSYYRDKELFYLISLIWLWTKNIFFIFFSFFVNFFKILGVMWMESIYIVH